MMRHTAALAVAPAALAMITLTGCQGSGTASTAGAISSLSTPAQPAASSSGSTPGAPASASTPRTSRCQPPSLTAALTTEPVPAGTQYTVRIVFTNTSSSSCSMDGYPGVDLIGHGTTWPLERQAATPARVLLGRGGTATSTLTFLRWHSGDGVSFTPARVEVTPPDDTTHITIHWLAGVPVLLQDAATHPGTYIGPVTEPGAP